MRLLRPFAVLTLLALSAASAAAQPSFVNGLVIPGATLDATKVPGANAGRFGQFSDLYYDPIRDEWWALSDRGPGGGLLDYAVRVQRIDLQVHPITGRISNFRVKETVTLTDKYGLLPPRQRWPRWAQRPYRGVRQRPLESDLSAQRRVVPSAATIVLAVPAMASGAVVLGRILTRRYSARMASTGTSRDARTAG